MSRIVTEGGALTSLPPTTTTTIHHHGVLSRIPGHEGHHCYCRPVFILEGDHQFRDVLVDYLNLEGYVVLPFATPESLIATAFLKCAYPEFASPLCLLIDVPEEEEAQQRTVLAVRDFVSAFGGSIPRFFHSFLPGQEFRQGLIHWNLAKEHTLPKLEGVGAMVDAMERSLLSSLPPTHKSSTSSQ